MHVVVGIAIMIVALFAAHRLARWSGADMRFRPDFLRLFIYDTVAFGAFVGGLYYVQIGSPSRVLRGAAVAGLAFRAAMTGLYAVIFCSMYLFRPKAYEFLKAWTDAHVQHGISAGAPLRAGRQRVAAMKQYRERWEQEGHAVSADEFIRMHWEEIAAADGAIG